MKTLYLMRHFKVKDKITHKLSAAEFNSWVEAYDTYDLDYLNIDIPNVESIYVSSQNRAIKTAEYLQVDFEIIDKLQEVDAKAFFSTNKKFSKSFWLAGGRLLWYLNLSATEKRKETIRRATEIICKLEDNESKSMLLISHGLFLKVLTAELKKLGYQGKMDFKPQNAQIYEFTKL